MRKTLLPILFCALTAPSAIAQISSTGLIAHWRFSGNALDSSGNAHHGTPTVVSYTAGRDGFSNTAAVFNAPTSYIAVPYAADLNVVNYSICAIIKPTVFNTGSCQGNTLLERAGAGSSAPGIYGLGFSDNAFDSNCNAFDTSKYAFYAFAGYGTPSYAAGQYTPTIRTNEWTSVVATYNGNAVRIYVNGVFKTIQPFTSGIGTSSNGIGIGSSPSQPTYRFTGVMDDLRLYNRVLTDSEIYIYHNPPVTNAVADVRESGVDFMLSPNPATASISIEMADPASSSYSIVDGLGRSVMTGSLLAQQSSIDISALAPGVYFIRLASRGGVSVKQFIKE